MIKTYLKNLLKKLWHPLRLLIETLSIYMLWITIHYVAAYEYNDWCVLKISKNICFTVKLWLMEYIVIHCVGYMYLVLKTQKLIWF